MCFEAGVEPNSTIRGELAEVKKLTGYAKQKAMKALQEKYPLFRKARFAHRQAMEAAEPPGTNMHAQLEHYIKDCIENNMGEPCSCSNERRSRRGRACSPHGQLRTWTSSFGQRNIATASGCGLAASAMQGP